MAITKFQPKVWSSRMLRAYDGAVVLGQSSVVNRDYEGEISGKGQSVTITNLVDPDVYGGYDKFKDLPLDQLSDEERELVIDQGDFYSFLVNDVDKKQAQIPFVNEATRRVGNKLAMKVETHLAKRIGGEAEHRFTVQDAGEAGAIYAALVRSWGLLADATDDNVENAWACLPIRAIESLLNDPEMKEYFSAQTMRQGAVGNLAGFDIMRSTRLLKTTTSEQMVFGSGNQGLTVANQLTQTEALRSERRIADIVRGLHVYGSKVVRAETLGTVELKGEAFGSTKAGTPTTLDYTITGDRNFAGGNANVQAYSKADEASHKNGAVAFVDPAARGVGVNPSLSDGDDD